VVNSASPRSIQLSSPTDDASRYSGLLSVLQDIIGPTAQDDQTLVPSPVHTKDDFSDTTLVEFNRSSQEQHKTLHPVDISASTSFAEASTLGECSDLCHHHQDSSIIETPRDVEETREIITHGIDSHNDGELWDSFSQYVVDHDDGVEEQNLEHEEAQEASVAMTALRSPSLLSRFSNTSTTSSAFSLLARPRGFTEDALDDSGQEVTNDLLSPVNLSAGLQPFPVRGTPPKREDSIDSGYADSWTGPTLLARSPPHVMRNSIAFDSGPLPCLSVPSLQNRRVSYDVRAVRPSPRQSIAVEERYDDTFPTSSILDAHEFSHEFDEEEESDSPTIRLAEKVAVSSSSSPDGTVEALPHQCLSAPDDNNVHSSAEPLGSQPSPPTVRPSFVKNIPSFQEVTPVEIGSCILPPSPSSELAPFDIVFTGSRAEDVITPSSVSSSGNESEAIGVFPSGCSSPNTSIFSVECDYTVDDTSQENAPFHPPLTPESTLAQSPIPPSASICTSVVKENSEMFFTGSRERPKITPELLAHIGHVFSLSDEMSAPVDDVHILDPTGDGKDVQTTDPGATWRTALDADVQQALHMSAISPVTSLSGNAEFVPDEADACMVLDPDLGDSPVNLRRWSGEEDVPSAMEDTSASSVEDGKDDALRDQSSISECWSKKEIVFSPATLTSPAVQAIERHDTDASLIQGKHDTQITHVHDHTPDPLDLADTLSATTTGPIPPRHDDFPTPSPPHQTAEFVQRSRATSDVTVKPNSHSPSAPYFPASPVASISANSPHTDLDPDHPDFMQPLNYVDTLPTESSTDASIVELAVETEEPQNIHVTPPPESTVYGHENECSPVSVKTKAPPNLTIRIPSSCRTKSSSPSTAQSLPLILSLSSGHDTRRWFSSPGADSARTDVSSASAPVISSLRSQKGGSTKVPFGFRRFNPQVGYKVSLS